MALFARTLAIVTLAPLLAVAAPLAASATASPYPVSKPDTWSRTIPPSTVVVHDVPAGVFDASSPLQVTVTSECPAPTLGLFAASQLTGRLTSDGAGGAVLTLDFGATSCGVYDVTVAEIGAAKDSYGVVTVITTDPASSTTTAASTSVLAHTGTTISVAVLAATGLALALGALLMIGSRLRRRRQL